MSSSPPSESTAQFDIPEPGRQNRVQPDVPEPADLPAAKADPVAQASWQPRTKHSGVRARLRPWSAWTLRAKLVASMLALFTVLSLATGAFTVVALNRQLVSQVDDQLRPSMARIITDRRGLDLDADPTNGPRGPGDEGLVAFIPSAATSAFPSAKGKATAGNGGQVQLTTEQMQRLSSAGVGADARSVEITGLGTYRVQALPTSLNAVDAKTGAQVSIRGALVIGLPMDPAERTVQRMVVIALGAAAAGILLVFLVGSWIVRRNLEPLRRVAGTATKVSRMPLDSGQVALAERVASADTDTRTEVGQVGAAFNEMLDHVDSALNSRHQSEQRVRQFVADASHELRTPLTSIKGYAELSKRETEAVPSSVTHAMLRIESEANRMSSLVEDLLLLARLDAGRPLGDDTVDLSMLVINAVSDAHAAAPDHRWELDLPPEPVETRGDPARLYQIVANLLGNARTHTPKNTAVTTSVRREGDWVRIAVHDNGPGVPTALQRNVFERFARGDDARNRAGGSTGLGLSIVSAVVKAHGGRVELASTPGDTTFSLLLPARRLATPPPAG